ncbi:hypothetical protein AAMO2058_000850800 [Amorphochlora amoebiformis]
MDYEARVQVQTVLTAYLEPKLPSKGSKRGRGRGEGRGRGRSQPNRRYQRGKGIARGRGMASGKSEAGDEKKGPLTVEDIQKEALKRIKLICRQVPASVPMFHELLISALSSSKLRLRHRSLHIIDILFNRSQSFRHKILSDFHTIVRGAIGTKQEPLPMPKARRLQAAGLEMIGRWHRIYGNIPEALHMRNAYKYIKSVLSLNFPQVSQLPRGPQADSIRRHRLRELLLSRYMDIAKPGGEIEEEMPETTYLLSQLDGVFALLVPHVSEWSTLRPPPKPPDLQPSFPFRAANSPRTQLSRIPAESPSIPAESPESPNRISAEDLQISEVSPAEDLRIPGQSPNPIPTEDPGISVESEGIPGGKTGHIDPITGETIITALQPPEASNKLERSRPISRDGKRLRENPGIPSILGRTASGKRQRLSDGETKNSSLGDSWRFSEEDKTGNPGNLGGFDEGDGGVDDELDEWEGWLNTEQDDANTTSTQHKEKASGLDTDGDSSDIPGDISGIQQESKETSGETSGSSQPPRSLMEISGNSGEVSGLIAAVSESREKSSGRFEEISEITEQGRAEYGILGKGLGVVVRSHAIEIELGQKWIKETEDNKVIFDQVRDLYKLLMAREFPRLERWNRTLSRVKIDIRERRIIGESSFQIYGQRAERIRKELHDKVVELIGSLKEAERQCRVILGL